MIQKINALVETILQGIAQSPEVECVQRIPYHGGGMPSSPLFCLKLDVFYRGEIPPYPDRLATLPPLQFIETSLSKEKDRFFLQKVPIHLDHKVVAKVDQELDGLGQASAPLRNETTYGLFRLYHGIPVHSKSDWIRDVKTRLENLPEGFWTFQRRNLAGRLEHQLSDMAAAIFNRDGLFFQLALARYLETLTELLFAVNRQFLCPQEELKFQLDGLEILPGGFTGYFDSLLRDDAGFDRERKLSLARHLTEGVLALV
jgi:hypothetical protein